MCSYLISENQRVTKDGVSMCVSVRIENVVDCDGSLGRLKCSEKQKAGRSPRHPSVIFLRHYTGTGKEKKRERGGGLPEDYSKFLFFRNRERIQHICHNIFYRDRCERHYTASYSKYIAVRKMYYGTSTDCFQCSGFVNAAIV